MFGFLLDVEGTEGYNQKTAINICFFIFQQLYFSPLTQVHQYVVLSVLISS